MSKLIDLLLQAGLVSSTKAADARNLQVLYGDRIGTNLIASGALREATLARALGALHQVPYAAGKDADSRPQFTRGLHRNAAIALRAVPAFVDEKRAVVFMTDPHDDAARAQLAGYLERTIEPVVVCEARMWWLLHKFTMARKASRLLVLDDEDHTPRRRIRPRSQTRPMSMFSGEGALDDPTATNALPPGDASWPSFLGPSPVTQPDAPPVTAPPSSTSPASTSNVSEGFVFDDPTTPMALPPSTAWPSFLGPEPVRHAGASSSPAPSASSPLAPPVAFHHDDVAEELLVELEPVEDEPVIRGVLVPPPRDASPLSLDEAKKMLAVARDRDEIALIVLRSCLSLFARAVLLTVQADTAVGWDGVGDGIDLAEVKEMRLPLKPPSIFQLARDSRAHFLGPLPKEKVNILFLKLTGAQIPKSALVVPIVVRGGVVNLLYCDNGKGRQVSTDIGDMLVVAQHINRSYEHLLKT